MSSIGYVKEGKENVRGLLREYYSKEMTDFLKIDIEEVIKNFIEITIVHKQYLNVQFPFEVFLHELSILNIL